MTPLEVAARFAAFTWYTRSRKAPSRVVQREARQFALDHWEAFLPVAHEGWGRLLLQAAQTAPARGLGAQRHRLKRRAAPAGV